MGATILHSSAWELVERQHGVVARGQLLAVGLSAKAIRHRVAKGRLHVVRPGVYAVGRPELTRYGIWMAAVLSCGPEAVLSHRTAAALWEIRRYRGERVEISVPREVRRNRPGLTIYRRAVLQRTQHHGIPTTPPAATLIDLAATVTRKQLEAAINEADNHDLIDPDTLRKAAEQTRRPGAKALRHALDEATFTLTRSQLERSFPPIARNAGLPTPRTQAKVNGYEVDFHWPTLNLVVETDSLRYHRTPTQQATDHRRDQAHARGGLTPLRFTHHQVAHHPANVQATLQAVALRLA